MPRSMSTATRWRRSTTRRWPGSSGSRTGWRTPTPRAPGRGTRPDRLTGMSAAFAPGDDRSRPHEHAGPLLGEGSAEAVAAAGVRLAASVSGCQPVGIFLTRAGQVIGHDWLGVDDGARAELAESL